MHPQALWLLRAHMATCVIAGAKLSLVPVATVTVSRTMSASTFPSTTPVSSSVASYMAAPLTIASPQSSHAPSQCACSVASSSMPSTISTSASRVFDKVLHQQATSSGGIIHVMNVLPLSTGSNVVMYTENTMELHTLAANHDVTSSTTLLHTSEASYFSAYTKVFIQYAKPQFMIYHLCSRVSLLPSKFLCFFDEDIPKLTMPLRVAQPQDALVFLGNYLLGI